MKKRLETPMLLVIDMQNVYGKGQAWECKLCSRLESGRIITGKMQQ